MIIYQDCVRRDCYYENDFLDVNEDELVRDIFKDENSDNETLNQRSSFAEIVEQSRENVNVLDINAFDKLSCRDIDTAVDWSAAI